MLKTIAALVAICGVGAAPAFRRERRGRADAADGDERCNGLQHGVSPLGWWRTRSGESRGPAPSGVSSLPGDGGHRAEAGEVVVVLGAHRERLERAVPEHVR